MNEQLFNNFVYILSGTLVTMQYTLIAISGGLIIGTIFAILNYYNKGTMVINTIVSFIRGTPLLLQLSFVYFVLPSLFGIKLSVLAAGAIAFSLNSGAYVSEIIRAGINSIDNGQFEAAHVLKIPRFYMWKDIIMPQALNNMLPALVNEIITILKETAIISMFGEVDIMRRSQLVAAEQFNYFQPLCIAAICYYVLVYIIEHLGKYVDRKLSYD